MEGGGGGGVMLSRPVFAEIFVDSCGGSKETSFYFGINLTDFFD